MTIKNKMLLGALLLVTSAAWAAPATAGSTNTSGISKYELSSFIADFKHFKPGDTVPEMYRTDEYNIKQWQLRNLPAPDAGTHWTYMGGAYVLINLPLSTASWLTALQLSSTGRVKSFLARFPSARSNAY